MDGCIMSLIAISVLLSSLLRCLLQQLDGQMHKMMREKKARQERIAKDKEEIDKIDGMIKTHVQPNLVRWRPLQFTHCKCVHMSRVALVHLSPQRQNFRTGWRVPSGTRRSDVISSDSS
jgi:hypothetical protein